MTSVAPLAPGDTQGVLPARAGGRLLMGQVGGRGTIGRAGALLHARIERDDPHGLWRDDREQLADHLAHNERRLVPSGSIQRKPCRQGERGRHRTSPAQHREAWEALHERRCQSVPEAKVAALSRQLLQQRLRLLQVGRVKALGEPAVDRGEQIVGFGALVLLLPEPTQAHGRPQLP